MVVCTSQIRSCRIRKNYAESESEMRFFVVLRPLQLVQFQAIDVDIMDLER
jgi:hypothetical protein